MVSKEVKKIRGILLDLAKGEVIKNLLRLLLWPIFDQAVEHILIERKSWLCLQFFDI